MVENLGQKIITLLLCVFLLGATYRSEHLNIDYKYKKDLRIAQTEHKNIIKFFSDRNYDISDIRFNIEVIHKINFDEEKQMYYIGWYIPGKNIIYITSSLVIFPADRLQIQSRNGTMRHEMAHAVLYNWNRTLHPVEQEYFAGAVEIYGYSKKIRLRLLNKIESEVYSEFKERIAINDKKFLREFYKKQPDIYHILSYKHFIDTDEYYFYNILDTGGF